MCDMDPSIGIEYSHRNLSIAQFFPKKFSVSLKLRLTPLRVKSRMAAWWAKTSKHYLKFLVFVELVDLEFSLKHNLIEVTRIYSNGKINLMLAWILLISSWISNANLLRPTKPYVATSTRRSHPSNCQRSSRTYFTATFKEAGVWVDNFSYSLTTQMRPHTLTPLVGWCGSLCWFASECTLNIIQKVIILSWIWTKRQSATRQMHACK